MRETVSVIIPTWNRAAELERAVKSALNQTFPVLEVLVCDDGSDDNSKEIISRLNDLKVKWIDCGRNGRPAIPRNKGIKESKGEWIAFLDSDDEWLPEKIEKQILAARDQNASAVCCNAIIIDTEGNVKGEFHSGSGRKISFKELLLTNHVICSSAMVKRALLDNAGGFPEKGEFKAIEDYALWLKVAEAGSWYFMDEALVKYSDAPADSIRANDIDTWQQRKIIFKDLINWIDKNKRSAATDREAVKRELQRAMYYTGENVFTRIKYRFI